MCSSASHMSLLPRIDFTLFYFLLRSLKDPDLSLNLLFYFLLQIAGSPFSCDPKSHCSSAWPPVHSFASAHLLLSHPGRLSVNTRCPSPDPSLSPLNQLWLHFLHSFLQPGISWFPPLFFYIIAQKFSLLNFIAKMIRTVLIFCLIPCDSLPVWICGHTTSLLSVHPQAAAKLFWFCALLYCGFSASSKEPARFCLLIMPHLLFPKVIKKEIK